MTLRRNGAGVLATVGTGLALFGAVIAATGWAAPADAPHRIGVRIVNGSGELFDRRTGRRFVPRGANYVRLATEGHSTFNVGRYAGTARFDGAHANASARLQHGARLRRRELRRLRRRRWRGAHLARVREEPGGLPPQGQEDGPVRNPDDAVAPRRLCGHDRRLATRRRRQPDLPDGRRRRRLCELLARSRARASSPGCPARCDSRVRRRQRGRIRRGQGPVHADERPAPCSERAELRPLRPGSTRAAPRRGDDHLREPGARRDQEGRPDRARLGELLRAHCTEPDATRRHPRPALPGRDRALAASISSTSTRIPAATCRSPSTCRTTASTAPRASP